MSTTWITKAELARFRQEMGSLATRHECELLRKDLEILKGRLTIRWTVMLIVSYGIFFAALKLT